MQVIDSIFVYGTLKQNQVRSRFWPCLPQSIQPAVIRAALYDTGPFPAILSGDDWVLGELWMFAHSDIEKTLSALDEVEGFVANRLENLYDRIETEATLGDGAKVNAFTYCYADRNSLNRLRRIESTKQFAGHACAEWPDALSRVPRSVEEE
ncbi:MAG: gamma-glutamylcyclotransferase family protein [Pirellulaceae bacterium]|nr:gamma-glutamylcyclotransferase family protein [Pirellulaceae bacterium]